MRIGLDLLPLQSDGSRDRGVGRYARRLVRALMEARADLEFVGYESSDLPRSELERSAFSNLRIVDLASEFPQPTLYDRWTTLVDQNPHSLDVLLVVNPFELVPGYQPPTKPLNRLQVCAVIYDFIPQLFPESYLSQQDEAQRYRSRLETIRCYDRLLAISEATRADALRILQIKEDRVVNIGGAIDHDDRDATASDPGANFRFVGSQRTNRRFILHVGGRDDRKNVWVLIDAYSRLPESLRSTYDLFIAGHYDDAYIERMESAARDAGVSDGLKVVGRVSEQELKDLYQDCTAFVFPSLYEGLGLPILEAMACGAPVIAGRNSAQTEVVGNAGILIDPLDARALTEAMVNLLTNEALANDYREKGPLQARRRTWSQIGRSAAHALLGVSRIAKRQLHRKRRVAICAPFPPKRTGIADHAARQATALADQLEVELFHTRDYIPQFAISDPRFRCFDVARFPRRSSVNPYDVVIYHMGNSWYHQFVYETWKRFPGVVILHDFHLGDFHQWYDATQGMKGGHIRRILEEEGSDFCTDRKDRSSDPSGADPNTVAVEMLFNHEIFRNSPRVVVHSQWCVQQVRKMNSSWADRTVHIPLGAEPKSISATERRTVRERYDLPIDAVLIGFIGNLTRAKMYEEAIAAFEQMASTCPEARLVFAGKDWEEGHAHRLARQSAASDQIVFLGPISAQWYQQLVGCLDVGLSLRRPPTFGETSASLLDQLSAGVATIVTDAGSFAEVLDSVVHRWRPEREGIEGLARALSSLTINANRRSELAKAGIRYIEERHHWSIVTERYVELVEELAEARARSFHVA